MTNQQHPLTPPPELVQQWLGEFFGCTVSGELSDSERFLATRAAQWGADQELEACCEWLQHDYPNIGANALRTARRPKPPSLKEQALAVLEEEPEDTKKLIVFDTDQVNLIRRALKALPDD